MPASYLNSLGNSQIQEGQYMPAASELHGKGVDTIGTTSTIAKEGAIENSAEMQTNMTSKIKAAEMTTDPDGNQNPQSIQEGTENQYDTGIFSEIEPSKLISLQQQNSSRLQDNMSPEVNLNTNLNIAPQAAHFGQNQLN